MGLQTDIQTKISAAFDGVLADAVTSVTFYDETPVYDPSTGIVSENVTEYPTRGVLDQYSMREIENSGGLITNKDNKILVMTNEIEVSPQVGWKMKIAGDDTEFIVRDLRVDPVGATFTIQVRA